jgi:hypothetical protein
MKTLEAPVLRYDRMCADDATEAAPAAPARISRMSEAVTMCVLGVCLAAWSIIGLFLWIPRLVRAVLAFSVSLVHSTVAETGAQAAGRRLRSAANFYRRGFATALESVRAGHEDSEEGEDVEGAARVRWGPIIREAALALFVWYLILSPTGVVPTPVALMSWLGAVPWSELWSSVIGAVASIPNLFRG